MDTKQLEAIRIAEWLKGIRGNTWPSYIPQEAAAELLRLQSENEQLRAGYDAARQEIASLRAQPYDQQAMGLCHRCGWKGVIDYPDGPVCVACEHDKSLSPQPTAQPLHVAATSCPHEIDKDKIVLHFDSKQPGKNALAQLAARLQAAQALDARWVSAKDRLPDPFCEVLVHPRPTDYCCEGSVNTQGEWSYGEYEHHFGHNSIKCNVTHWMPLPTPPVAIATKQGGQ